MSSDKKFKKSFERLLIDSEDEDEIEDVDNTVNVKNAVLPVNDSSDGE